MLARYNIKYARPTSLAKYISEKGSITVDGISLTVNAIDGATFSLNIVPHTVQETNVGSWQTGSVVNLEVDLLARYLERLLLGDKAAQSSAKNDISLEFLAQTWFYALIAQPMR
jgi:riboflavin synthase